MKRTVGIICCLGLVILLSACGGGNEKSEAPGGQSASSQQDPAEGASPEKTQEPSSRNNISEQESDSEQENGENSEDNQVAKMYVQVGDTTFSATLEDNAAVDQLVKMMQKAPVVVEMSDYSGFEKVGSLDANLTASNSQMTTQSGDIVLYNGNQIVMFYGSNSWSYTKLGKIDDLSGWREALGNGDVTVTFSVE